MAEKELFALCLLILMRDPIVHLCSRLLHRLRSFVSGRIWQPLCSALQRAWYLYRATDRINATLIATRQRLTLAFDKTVVTVLISLSIANLLV